MRYLLLLALVFFVSCTSPQVVMDSWLGKTEHELIQSWGPPSKRDSDGAGGQVLTYAQTVQTMQTPGTISRDYNGNIQYTNPQQMSYEKYRQFYVNPSGTIYSHRWQGY